MKHTVIALAVIAAVGVSGCASNKVEPVSKVENKLEMKPDIPKSEATFLTESGTVTLEFAEDGSWLVVKATATAPVNFNHSQGRDDAFTIATMRAKRNLAEFLNNDVKSDKVTESLTRTALRDIVKNENTESKNRKTLSDFDEDTDTGPEGNQYSAEERRRASRIVTSVQESISDRTQAVLKGAYIADRKVNRENNLVSVTIQASRKSINAAGTIRSLMGQL